MRCELFNYVEALLRSPRQKSTNILFMFMGMFAVAVSFYFGIAAMNFWALAVSFLSGFVYVLSVTVGTAYAENTPNVASLMPLSPRKALLYRFAGTFIIFVLYIAIMLAVVLVVGGIVGGIVLLIEFINNNVTAEGGEIAEEVEILSHMGVHGGIFAAAYFVFMYGMGMVVGFIKNAKTRLITAGCLCAAILGGMLLMHNPFLQESYDKMAVPWLCTVLCCLAAVAALGTAVYLGIKRYNKTY